MSSASTCIIGAGPGGLAAARALKRYGIPYEQFERHSDVGGLWDKDNPGTPLYDSAHFISSKTQSAFTDCPMPDSYPDYPSGREILDYIHHFAERYGLKDAVRFNTGVERAEPDGKGGWTVTLSNGVPIESVSKMLGHTSLKTTQIYAKVLDSKISDDMEKL